MRTVIALVLVAAAGLWCVAEAQAQASEPPQGAGAFKDTSLAKSAPPALRKLIEDGDTTVEFVTDPGFVKLNRGNCTFNLHATYQFKYSFKLLAPTSDGRARVRITLYNMRAEVTLKHRVRIPDRYSKPKPWETRLMLHEFDHVAISLDPRPKALLRYLAEHLPPFERTLGNGEKPSNDFYRTAITEEANKRKAAVTDLIQRAYEALDETSLHGAVPIPDRPRFFGQLFSEERLAEMRFPFLAEARDALEAPEYSRPGLRFLPMDPTGK
jgi:hypothetical protein